MFAVAVLVAFAAPRGRAPASRAAQRCPFAYRGSRGGAAEGLARGFRPAGFEVARGSMWFMKSDTSRTTARTCYYANPTSTYGCPMLVRRDATNGDATPSSHDPHPPSQSSPTARPDDPYPASPRQRVHLSRLGARDPDANVVAARRPVLGPRDRHSRRRHVLDRRPHPARRGEPARQTSARTRSSRTCPSSQSARGRLSRGALVAGARNIARRRRPGAQGRRARRRMHAAAVQVLPDGPPSRASGAFARSEVPRRADARHPRNLSAIPVLLRHETDPFARRPVVTGHARSSPAGEVPPRCPPRRARSGQLVRQRREGVLRGVPCWKTRARRARGRIANHLERRVPGTRWPPRWTRSGPPASSTTRSVNPYGG